MVSGESEMFGRIIGESEDGSWGEINGIQMFSIPLFSTPGGNVLKTGIIRIHDLNGQADLDKLYKFEQLAGNDVYNKRLIGVDLPIIDKRIIDA